MYKATVSRAKWDNAVARARTERANRDEPQFGRPPKDEVIDALEHVIRLTPLPTAEDVRSAGFFVQLDAEGNVLRVDDACDFDDCGKMGTYSVPAGEGCLEVEGRIDLGNWHGRKLYALARALCAWFVVDDGTTE